jgi:hypothetical protein
MPVLKGLLEIMLWFGKKKTIKIKIYVDAAAFI